MNSIARTTITSGAEHSRHFVKLVAATAALAGLLFGFDTGVISGAILFIKGKFGLTLFTEELLVSAALVGAVCGSILSGRLTDLIGRKRAILITDYPVIRKTPVSRFAILSFLSRRIPD